MKPAADTTQTIFFYSRQAEHAFTYKVEGGGFIHCTHAATYRPDMKTPADYGVACKDAVILSIHPSSTVIFVRGGARRAPPQGPAIIRPGGTIACVQRDARRALPQGQKGIQPQNSEPSEGERATEDSIDASITEEVD